MYTSVFSSPGYMCGLWMFHAESPSFIGRYSWSRIPFSENQKELYWDNALLRLETPPRWVYLHLLAPLPSVQIASQEKLLVASRQHMKDMECNSHGQKIWCYWKLCSTKLNLFVLRSKKSTRLAKSNDVELKRSRHTSTMRLQRVKVFFNENSMYFFLTGILGWK